MEFGRVELFKLEILNISNFSLDQCLVKKNNQNFRFFPKWLKLHEKYLNARIDIKLKKKSQCFIVHLLS